MLRLRLLLPLLPALLTACVDKVDLLEEWQAEADAHGPMGAPGTFTATAAADGSTRFDLAGEIAASGADGPFTISGSSLAITPVVVDGVTGQLVSSGGARFSAGHADAFSVATLADFGTTVVVNVDTTLSSELPVTGAVLEQGSFQLLPDDGSAPVQIDVTGDAPLAIGDVRVRGTGLALSLDGESGLQATIPDLALGGSADVAVVVEDADVDVTGASAVFGRDMAVDVSAGACAGEGRVTQAVKDGEILIDADVEVEFYDSSFDEAAFSDEMEIEVFGGVQRSIVFAFRERGYVGDAVVTSVEVKGEGKEHIRIAATPPEGPATTIIGAMQQDGVIDAGEALVLVVAGPAIVIVDIISSIGDIFGGDDGAALSPAPIPSWIQAGQVGFFSVVADVPSSEVGERIEVTVVVEGANFKKQTKTFFLLVVEQE